MQYKQTLKIYSLAYIYYTHNSARLTFVGEEGHVEN